MFKKNKFEPLKAFSIYAQLPANAAARKKAAFIETVSFFGFFPSSVYWELCGIVTAISEKEAVRHYKKDGKMFCDFKLKAVEKNK
jgi:hypothetical protein